MIIHLSLNLKEYLVIIKTDVLDFLHRLVKDKVTVTDRLHVGEDVGPSKSRVSEKKNNREMGVSDTEFKRTFLSNGTVSSPALPVFISGICLLANIKTGISIQ